MFPKIDQNTRIRSGLPLSKNFLLDHLTSGAFHPVMGEWVPRFTGTLIPDPKLFLNMGIGRANQIARNLQVSADRILENLLFGFGQDLVLRSGFLNNVSRKMAFDESAHLLGNALDIQIKGFETNMYPISREIQKLTKGASQLGLVFGGTSSWVHIGIDPKKAQMSTLGMDLVPFSTTDLVSGVSEKGITSLRGFI